MRNENFIFLYLNKNICCGYSKEPSQKDGSFEHPKHMLQLIGKKIFTFYAENFCLSKPVLRSLKIVFYLRNSENSDKVPLFVIFYFNLYCRHIHVPALYVVSI